MKIKSFNIKNFKKFNMSEIKELNITFDKDIILILGTNGSGKTSLLHELVPLANKNNLFNDDKGYKEEVIEHDNNEYKLITHSKKKTNIEHSFIYNGKDLNINNTYSMQQDLINKHFNITPDIYSLLTNSVKITEMTLAQRKQFIAKINPYELTYLIKCLKNVIKQKRLLTTHITLLKNREKELIKELLNEEEVKKLQSILKEKNKEKEYYSNIYNYINHELNKINLNINIEELIHKQYKLPLPILKEIYYIYQRYEVDNKEELSIKVINIKNKLDNINKEYFQLTNKAKELTKEIEELQENCNYDDKLKKEIEEKIKEIENKKNSIKIQDNFIPIDKFYLDDNYFTMVNRLKSIIDKIINIKSELNNYHLNINPEKYIYQVNKCSYLLSDKKNELQELIKKKEEIENKILQIDENSLPCNDGIRMSCGLYLNYHQKYISVNKELEKINNLITKNKTIINKLENIIEIRKNRIKKINNYNYYIKECNEIFNQYNYINNVMSFNDFKISILSIYPYKIIELLKEYYQDSIQYYKKQELDKEYQELTAELKNINKVNNNSKTILIKLLSSKQNELNVYNNKITQVRNKLDYYNKYYNRIDNDYKTLCNFINEYYLIDKELDGLINSLNIYLSKKFYQTLFDYYREIIEGLNQRTINIESKLREQEILNVRIEKEIKEQLLKLYPQLELIKRIEQELININSKYNIEFTKNIIKNTNILINKIFTYKIELYSENLEVLSEDTSIEFEESDFEEMMKFSVKIEEDTIVDNINKCSSGQKDIINLCFNLAILIELGIKNYPIFLDEVDKALDNLHRERLLLFLYELVELGIVTQIFLVSNTHFHQGLLGQYIVLDNRNINIDNEYNVNVKILNK